MWRLDINLIIVSNSLPHVVSTRADYISPGASIVPLDLSKNAVLKDLYIAGLNLSAFDLPHMSPAMPSHVVPTVTSLKSDMLESVSFHIHLDSLPWFDVISWDELDAFLSGIKTLQVVVFFVDSWALSHAEIQRVIQNRMSECHHLDLLRLEVTGHRK